MTTTDIALIATAAACVTAAVLITCWHLHVASYRRALDRVRRQRDRFRAEAWELRADLGTARGKWLDHVSTAIAQATVAEPSDDEPIAYTIPSPYLPSFTPGRVAADLDSVTVALRVARKGHS